MASVRPALGAASTERWVCNVTVALWHANIAAVFKIRAAKLKKKSLHGSYFTRFVSIFQMLTRVWSSMSSFTIR